MSGVAWFKLPELSNVAKSPFKSFYFCMFITGSCHIRSVFIQVPILIVGSASSLSSQDFAFLQVSFKEINFLDLYILGLKQNFPPPVV